MSGAGFARQRIVRWGIPILIAVLAAALRFSRLVEAPPALFRDELEKGYTAWELSETLGYGRLLMTAGGAVEPSLPFPLFIDVYGVRTSALYQWLSVPWVWMWGLSAWSTRFAAALAGTLCVWLIMLWARRVWGWKAAMWAGLWLAISPWHVAFSRWAQQGITEPLWLALMLYCFERGRGLGRGLGRRWSVARILWFSAAGIAAALALYAYEVARLFLPLWLLCLAAAHRKALWRLRREILPGAVLLAAAAVFVYSAAGTPEGSARFRRISVWHQAASAEAALAEIARNWAAHFDPRFLFLRGDVNPRHGLPGFALLHPAEAPLILLGIAFLLRRRKPWDWALLGWIILYPSSAALTREGIPHALRSIVGLPAWPVLSALGSCFLLQLVRQWSAKREGGTGGGAASASSSSSVAARELSVIALAPLIAFLLLIAAALSGGARVARTLANEWPPEAAAAFEIGEQRLVQALIAQPAPAKNLSGFIPYAPHRLLFHARIAPSQWREKGLRALPAAIYAPGELRSVWEKMRPGDQAGILAPEIENLPPGSYRILQVIRPSAASSSLDEANPPLPPSGFIIEKIR